MAFLSINELLDIIIMTAAVGFIFSDTFSRYSRKEDYEPLVHYKHGFDWEAFRFAAIITAPAVILHEFGHKFVAMALGVDATFHAAYFWLALGVVMKIIGGFIFLVPAFVSHPSVGPLGDSIIALSGPLVNLLLLLGALLVHRQKLIAKKYDPGLLLTAKINMFLFIFNMIPIPGFDGYSFFHGMIRLFMQG